MSVVIEISRGYQNVPKRKQYGPGKVPKKDLTTIEQQLISRISSCINVHMLNHGHIASLGHCVNFPKENQCVTFPKEINDQQKVFSCTAS